jgi:hypothetical protein
MVSAANTPTAMGAVSSKSSLSRSGALSHVAGPAANGFFYRASRHGHEALYHDRLNRISRAA